MKKNKVALYYSLIVVLLVLIGISSFLFNYFYNLRGEDLSLEEMTINEANKMSYNVKLFDNEFFKSSDEETNYVLSLVDNINTYFNYSTVFSSPVVGEYSYYVKGSVIMEENGEKVSNEIYRGDTASYNVNGSVINLSSSFDIDLDAVVRAFREQVLNLNLNVDSVIRYDVVYSYKVYSDELAKSLVNSRTLSVVIPVKDITNITITEDAEVMRKEFSDLNLDDNKLYLAICLEFIGAILIFVLLIALLVRRINGQVSVYEDALEKLLNKYDSHLVYLKELPDLADYNVLFVEEMEDLLATSKKTKTPISYIEVVDKHEATFMVLLDKQVYVYKFSSKNV